MGVGPGGVERLEEVGGTVHHGDPATTAAEASAWGGFVHAGQLCIGVGRHLVHRSIAEEYVAALVERAEALVVGDPRHGGRRSARSSTAHSTNGSPPSWPPRSGPERGS
ncbi:hypothetical protein CEP50_09510 [Actinopolyspora mortivallis]|uniref:Aldehyde dehydrogenase domain-containing protein n=1 Tax=Actinopolyspora mortivallis TaxID=33906 RepID=A0A2T0GWY7_ACTMO|nr:hypothetical protein CEP50_09510 [Actinopolyspora mortivallis]